ncbi:uncharacterized protein LOC117339206 [Pecten maximus]|uniref:uncharacterized protein LOC117339206 n=1 Tax=Pecten maximus TaxID=6579 RepID=UPI0014588C5E|nr:uncharacterized protein LOC117339206 [Pecten maximus]
MVCHITVVLIWGFMAVYLQRAVLSETRLCSQCRSDHQAECATEPPTPEPCPEGASFCSIIREKSMNGESVTLHRGCTTVMTQECVIRPVTNITACYSTCDTDGCNHGNSVTITSVAILMMSILSRLFIGHC